MHLKNKVVHITGKYWNNNILYIKMYQNILLYIFLIILVFVFYLSVNNDINNVYQIKNINTKLKNPEKIYKSKIPKVIIQTSKKDIPNYYFKLLEPNINGWKYKHFKDEDIIKFFKKYPIEDFKNIENVFYSIKRGEHRADLFRYYYLYVKGGVYLDTDLLIYKHIEDIIKDYDFVSLKPIWSNSITQAFLGSVSKSYILYQAIKNIYEMNIEDLNNNYILLLKNLYKIYNEKSNNKTNVHLYKNLFNIRYFYEYSIDDIDKKVIIRHFSYNGSYNNMIKFYK